MSPLLTWIAAAAAAEPTAFVAGDVVNLRPRPQLTGEPVALLRLGTEVTVLAEDARAARVRVAGRPEEARLEGWIARDLLTAERPTLAAVEAALADAATAEEERRWSTRRAALVGDPAADLWIGVCHRGRTELVARIDERTATRPAGAPWDQGPDPSLLRLGRALSAATWFAGPAPIEGTPFATPFPRSDWNDVGTTPWSAGDCGEICGDQLLVLGPCVGEVVATRPVIPVDPLEVPVRESRAPVVVASPADDGVSELRATVTLTRADGAPLFAMPEGLHALGETTWYALPAPEGTTWLARIPSAWSLNTEAETLVLLSPDGAVRVVTAALDGMGC